MALFFLVLVAVILCVSAAELCCVECTVPGQIKYYSIDTRHNKCGECCMDPADYDLYKKFEPGLEKASTNTPCLDLKYPNYVKTETHGAGNITMTLDMYAPDK